jgi:hypothetical protein
MEEEISALEDKLSQVLPIQIRNNRIRIQFHTRIVVQ